MLESLAHRNPAPRPPASALGLAIVGWVIGSLVPDTFPDLGIEVALGGPHADRGRGRTACWRSLVAPLFTLRRLRRMDVPATLRVME